MQGQRGTVVSMPETLEFDCGSASGNSTADPQICWNNVNPAENQIPDYILSPCDMNSSYENSIINHEWQNLSGWSLGEPSSSNTPNEINNNEQKRELGWSSTITAGALAGPRLEERRLEPTNALSLDNVNTGPIYMCSPNSHLMSQNLNLNAGLADSGSDDSQHLELPNLNKSSGSAIECIPPNVGSGSFLLPSGNNAFLVEDTDGRPSCSLDTRRVSCKRKAVEGNNGQSSDAGSSSYSQHTDGSAWHTIPTQDNAGSSSRRSIPSEEVNARLGLGIGDEASENVSDSNTAGCSESFHRNFRLRLNPSNPANSVPPTAFSTGSMIRHSGVSPSSQVSQRLHSVDNSMNSRSAPPIDNVVPQSQPHVIHVPALPRNRQSFRWSGGSSSRNIHSSNSIICPARDQEDASSRRMSRNMLEHPVFQPATDLSNLVQNPTVRASSSSSVNLSIPGNVASSQTGSNPATNPSSAPTWVSPPNPPQHPQRLSEYVRRSLFSPSSDATGSPSNNFSSLRSGFSTSEPRALSSGSGANPRSSSWLERQGGSEFGIPYSLRTLAVASEGSSRLVSELRNVLGLMRRGGNVRFEDVVILEHQSFLSGIADVHDRHGDMRLDVDNMSYEELLALEERIGNVSTGLSEETLSKLLKQRKHSVEKGSETDAEPCCVCQEDYGDGNDIGTLDCGHDFHSSCIKQWLMQKNLCPICKTTGLAT
ncbi:putative E3 ubiquitin-protein ligase RHG1A isoform E [Glycine soja]|uniref:RING-type E3 ubiquitin transferase n=1 Tax=Glycine soja TaxID=3848 RepID=A0A445KV88_GLYSO|nr:putative E3 ubiquitin-protein ligase RHG1A isoform E [Glycine soja]